MTHGVTPWPLLLSAHTSTHAGGGDPFAATASCTHLDPCWPSASLLCLTVLLQSGR